MRRHLVVGSILYNSLELIEAETSRTPSGLIRDIYRDINTKETKEITRNRVLEGLVRAIPYKNPHISHNPLDIPNIKKHPYYNTLLRIHEACKYSQHPQFPIYGAKGIRIHLAWDISIHGSRMALTAFINDMGYKPTPKHKLRRYEPHLNFNPTNCYWGTA